MAKPVDNLSATQAATLRRQLQNNIKALRARIGEELIRADKERYADLVEQVHDVEEQSVADLLSDINLSVIDLHINELRELEAAVQRMDDGRYNVCQNCHGEIGYERLRNVPEARRCVSCQDQHEKTHAGQRHSRL